MSGQREYGRIPTGAIRSELPAPAVSGSVAPARVLVLLSLVVAALTAISPRIGRAAATSIAPALPASCAQRSCDSAKAFAELVPSSAVVSQAHLVASAGTRLRHGHDRAGTSEIGRSLPLPARQANARSRVASLAQTRIDRHAQRHLPAGEPSPHDALAPPAAPLAA